MASGIISKRVESVIQHNVNGDVVGYYATRTFQTSELQNVSQGTVTVTNRNGVGCVKVTDLVCTPNTKIVDLQSYIGHVYVYDREGGSKMYIDNGWLYCGEANMGHRILTFC